MSKVDDILAEYGMTRENWETDPAMVADLIQALDSTIPDGYKLVCEKCGTDYPGPCGWPSNCPTGHGSDAVKL